MTNVVESKVINVMVSNVQYVMQGYENALADGHLTKREYNSLVTRTKLEAVTVELLEEAKASGVTKNEQSGKEVKTPIADEDLKELAARVVNEVIGAPVVKEPTAEELEMKALGLKTLGVYYTEAEKKELLDNGYEIVEAEGMTHRETLLNQYKNDGYMVRRCFKSAGRKVYDFYLVVKPRGLVVTTPKKKKAAKAKTEVSTLDNAVKTLVAYFQDEVATYVSQEQLTEESATDYKEYVALVANGDYRKIKKECHDVLVGAGIEVEKALEIDGVAYKTWFAQVKENVWAN